MRRITTWHSGSPKRTLYSISFGPSSVIISPANRTPTKGAPSFAIPDTVGAMISSMTRRSIASSKTGVGE